MQKVLITGISGFLAKHLVATLRHSAIKIIGLSRSITDFHLDGVSKIYHDVNHLIENEPEIDCVFHLAAFIPYHDPNETNNRLVNDNILLTSKLVTAYSTSRLVFSSSTSVYGIPKNLPIDLMTSSFHQPDTYGQSKLAAEAIIHNHKNYAIIRFSSIIGPGMKPISFIPKIIESAKKTGMVTLTGDGSRLQDYIDVRDAARLCYTCAINVDNFTIFGVSGKSISNKNIASIVQKRVPFSLKFEGADISPSFSYSIGDSYKEIGFTPSYSIEDTLKDMI